MRLDRTRSRSVQTDRGALDDPMIARGVLGRNLLRKTSREMQLVYLLRSAARAGYALMRPYLTVCPTAFVRI